MREHFGKALRAESGIARFFPITGAVLCWVAAVLFVKYFSALMDVHTQNFFRYLGASLFLSILLRMYYPGCFKRYRERLPLFLLLGGMVAGFQICWVNALYRLGPAFFSLLGKLSTILITLTAFLFYREERVIIRAPRFILGFVMGLAGVAGVVAGIPGFKLGLETDQRTGIALVVFSSLIWAFYINLVKRVLRKENSLQAFTFTCISATFFFLPAMLLRGHPATLLGGSLTLMAVVIVSGVIGIAGANSSYYLSIKRIGMARSANLILSEPFLVALVSYPVFGERLSPAQWIFGIILLTGCALIISVQAREEGALSGKPASK